jgi:microcystin-dependent protein
MDPFVGEIRIFGFNFAPRGWATCDGQLLPISQNTALFSLLGTQFGGNGQSTFALPNLQGSAPIDQGQGPGLTPRDMGETGGVSSVTLNSTQIPSHTHTMGALNGATGSTGNPQNNIFAGLAGRPTPPPTYSNAAPNVAMNPGAVSGVGGNQPHNNMPPYQVMCFCIAMQGIFPPRS